MSELDINKPRFNQEDFKKAFNNAYELITNNKYTNIIDRYNLYLKQLANNINIEIFENFNKIINSTTQEYNIVISSDPAAEIDDEFLLMNILFNKKFYNNKVKIHIILSGIANKADYEKIIKRIKKINKTETVDDIDHIQSKEDDPNSKQTIKQMLIKCVNQRLEYVNLLSEKKYVFIKDKTEFKNTDRNIFFYNDYEDNFQNLTNEMNFNIYVNCGRCRDDNLSHIEKRMKINGIITNVGNLSNAVNNKNIITIKEDIKKTLSSGDGEISKFWTDYKQKITEEIQLEGELKYYKINHKYYFLELLPTDITQQCFIPFSWITNIERNSSINIHPIVEEIKESCLKFIYSRAPFNSPNFGNSKYCYRNFSELIEKYKSNFDTKFTINITDINKRLNQLEHAFKQRAALKSKTIEIFGDSDVTKTHDGFTYLSSIIIPILIMYAYNLEDSYNEHTHNPKTNSFDGGQFCSIPDDDDDNNQNFKQKFDEILSKGGTLTQAYDPVGFIAAIELFNKINKVTPSTDIVKGQLTLKERAQAANIAALARIGIHDFISSGGKKTRKFKKLRKKRKFKKSIKRRKFKKSRKSRKLKKSIKRRKSTRKK